MEDGLRGVGTHERVMYPGLNPCCYGRWSQSIYPAVIKNSHERSLNPCCYGRWSQRNYTADEPDSEGENVLILVVMEDGLRGIQNKFNN